MKKILRLILIPALVIGLENCPNFTVKIQPSPTPSVSGSASPTPTATPSPSSSAEVRQGICNLLLSVGGTAADVEACLIAEGISDADKARLCAASANLSADQKETLRAGLISLGVDVNICEILGPVPTPTATATSATETPVPTPTSSDITTQLIAPTASPTSVSNSGSHNTGGGSDEEDIPLDVTVSEPTAIPEGITVE